MMTKDDFAKGEKEKELATKYHKVKFFERVKVDRKLQQTLKKLESTDADAAETQELRAVAAECQVRLLFGPTSHACRWARAHTTRIA